MPRKDTVEKRGIEINPKGIKCSCNPCSFKISRKDKTLNVSRDENGEIKLDSEDHSISFSFNRLTTPESDEEKKKYEMISDVMTTPRNNNRVKIDDLD